MNSVRPFQATRTLVVVAAALLLTCSAFAQNYVAPSTPVIGSPNTVTANAPVPRPATQPCTVTLFQNFDFADFNPKPFTYTPPSGCPGPWAAVVFEADWSVDPGVQFDRTANIWIAGTNIFFGTTAEPSGTFTRTWHTESNLTEYTPLFARSTAGTSDSRKPDQRPVHQSLSRQCVPAVLSAGTRADPASYCGSCTASVGGPDGRHCHLEQRHRPVGRHVHHADEC